MPSYTSFIRATTGVRWGGASRLSSSSWNRPWLWRAVTVRTLQAGTVPPPTPTPSGGNSSFEIPRRIKQKVVTAEDAVSLVQPGDTVAVSGFVCQGVPEGILRALAARYEATGLPHSLTLFFGGGPGDWDWRGLNHLAKKKEDGPPMLARTLGSHYGQVPMVAERALANEVEAWTLPMGSVSRMWRAQSTRSPGHLTTVGLGTYMVRVGRNEKVFFFFIFVTLLFISPYAFHCILFSFCIKLSSLLPLTLSFANIWNVCSFSTGP